MECQRDHLNWHILKHPNTITHLSQELFRYEVQLILITDWQFLGFELPKKTQGENVTAHTSGHKP